ncbi:MAG: hypoxanthine phosphoribosyltransferase [Hyphomicrobiaceae bacterium]|nr:hypoxanthine phosphoribosyltransferase [Hyphomicrobiaceae bacterium]
MPPANPRIDPLFSAAQIGERNKVLAREIAARHKRDLLVIPVLKGSFIFAADLIRELHLNGLSPQVDFLYLASYHDGTISSGKVDILRDIESDVTGRDVLLLDDILESGRTLQFALDLMKNRGAASVKICVFLDKEVLRAEHIKLEADYYGFKCPDLFVVGYGMDLAQRFRELPFVGHIVEE